MDNEYVENITASVVREYLSRKGLRATLQILDEEMPRDGNSISNRQQLARQLDIANLLSANKEQVLPLRAMLEVIIQFVITRRKSFQDGSRDVEKVGPGRDVEKVGPGRDVEKVGPGRDVEKVGLGRDVEKVGPGRDVEKVGPGRDVEKVGPGRDVEKVGPGRDVEKVGPGRDVEKVGPGRDVEKVGPGRDVEKVGLGRDVEKVGPGRDVEKVGPGRDVEKVGPGRDVEKVGPGRDVEKVGPGRDVEKVGPGRDVEKVGPSRSCVDNRVGGKPDWRIDGGSYVKTIGRPCTADLQAKAKSDTMVLEESEESETVVGSGKSCLMLASTKSDVALMADNFKQKGRVASMSGPLRSTSEKFDARRKQQRPRSDVLAAQSYGNDIQSNVGLHDVNGASKSDTRLRDKSGIKDVLNDDELNARPSRVTSQLDKMFSADARHVSGRIGNGYKTDETAEINVGVKRAVSLSSGSNSRSHDSPQVTKVGDLEICDVDLDDSPSNTEIVPLRPLPMKSLKWPSKPIDLNTAIKLKTLIFGAASRVFNSEWISQSFAFSDIPSLNYGIVQNKGGPCGVLASVQAYLLYEILFGSQSIEHQTISQLGHADLCPYLASALSRILWKAGDQERAVVVLPGRKELFYGGKTFKSDGVTEKLLTYSFNLFDNLKAFMNENISHFVGKHNPGVVLCLYSAILSRSIQQYALRIQSDMDDPSGQLMGAHNYCTQDMVNLLLSGRAVSNIFNGVTELASDDQRHVTRLRGISERSDVGLLSLFEHYGSCEVGTYYKTPKTPIWVVCSESHFSVLFSHKRDLMSDWKAERIFDLFYYDGLAKQDSQIKLTLDTVTRGYTPPSEEELCSPIELCIRTKWKDAHIDWNGSDPIL